MTEDHTIMTWTGRIVDPWYLQPENIDVSDIAHSLSLVNRFLGHSTRPISVAEHCLWVADFLADQPVEVQLAGLLHDASEAYLCDIPRPLKRRPEFASYRAAEARAERAISFWAGLPYFGIWPPEVKAADMASYDEEVARRWSNTPPRPHQQIEAEYVSMYDALHSLLLG